MKPRSAIVAIASIVLVAGLAMWLRPEVAVSEVSTAKDIQLVTHTGQIVDRQSVTGRPYLVHFGYTNCPDICPTALAELSRALEMMGEDAQKLTVYFVTVNPERDPANVLAQYLSAFDPRIIGLWGTRDDMTAFVRSFGANASRMKLPDGSYRIEHTTDLIFANAEGRVAARLSPLSTARELAGRLSTLLGHSSLRVS